MNIKKITPDTILDAIEKTAQMMVKKHELYESIKVINSEIKSLYESAPPMVGSYGFVAPGDPTQKAANISGFETNPNISYIAQLEKEMGIENGENTLNEIDNLKSENEELKKQIEELKSKISQ